MESQLIADKNDVRTMQEIQVSDSVILTYSVSVKEDDYSCQSSFVSVIFICNQDEFFS